MKHDRPGAGLLMLLQRLSDLKGRIAAAQFRIETKSSGCTQCTHFAFFGNIAQLSELE
jgi:hypothetical protein